MHNSTDWNSKMFAKKDFAVLLAAAGDIDNDGDLDIYVTTQFADQFLLFVNDGTGSFNEEAIPRGAKVEMDSAFSTDRLGTGVSMGDYDRDGFLDIHTNEWASRSDQPDFGIGSYTATAARLLHNRGASLPGFFEDITLEAGAALHDVPASYISGQPVYGVFSFASQFADIDQDGYADLVVAGDFSSSRLFWGKADGTFTDGTDLAGVGTDENGMGLNLGDYDGDGDLDLFVTSIFDADDPCGEGICNWGSTGNRLFRYDGNRQFTDQTDFAGVREGGWGWGTTWLDYDNDGDLDLAMTNGFDVGDLNDPTDLDYKFNGDPMRLWRNDGNFKFTEVSIDMGITDTRQGRGLLTLDYDNDGDLDLFVINNSDSPVLYRNDTITESSTNGNAWLKIDTIGTDSNRDGIGTQIIIDPDSSAGGDEIFREVSGANTYLAQSDTIVHLGLGTWTGNIDQVSVIWPSGYTQEFSGVTPNELITITEGLLADFDDDDSVDDSDLIVWESNVGTTGSAGPADGDANRDGGVDGADFLFWQRAYGKSVVSGLSNGNSSGSITVPEPSAIWILAAGLLVMVLVSETGLGEK